MYSMNANLDINPGIYASKKNKNQEYKSNRANAFRLFSSESIIHTDR